MNAALNYTEAIRDEGRIGESGICSRIRAGAMKVREGGRLIDEHTARQID
jgi:hypothetical protein